MRNLSPRNLKSALSSVLFFEKKDTCHVMTEIRRMPPAGTCPNKDRISYAYPIERFLGHVHLRLLRGHGVGWAIRPF